ncbi:hypothetical protein [Aureimonas sp. AU12]|uniref:hypothetical protein n=1 Tax=Aureimonas sp. AU12 TaxID=1638161 RepID=UPI00078574D6|nr:hypothetical protein [Aureimonas sp. AU12]
MRFTADDAFDVRGTDDAIILGPVAATAILAQHDATLVDFYEFTGADIDAIDAGDLLAFLGY